MNGLHDALIAWDRHTFLALNHGMKSKALDFLMPALTDIGLGYLQAIAVLLTAIYLEIRTGEVSWQKGARSIPAAIRTHRSWVGPLLVAVVMSGLTADVIKSVVPGDRPFWFYLHEHEAKRSLDVEVYTVPGTDPMRVRRFPSGHVTTTVAMAMVVTILYRRRKVGLWVAGTLWLSTVIVALSRIYLASHWPLDVIAGTILGVATGYLSVQVCQAWARKYHPRDGSEEPVAEAIEQQPEPDSRGGTGLRTDGLEGGAV